MQSDIFQNCLYGFCQEGQTINDKVMSFSLLSVHFHIKGPKTRESEFAGKRAVFMPFFVEQQKHKARLSSVPKKMMYVTNKTRNLQRKMISFQNLVLAFHEK